MPICPQSARSTVPPSLRPRLSKRRPPPQGPCPHTTQPTRTVPSLTPAHDNTHAATPIPSAHATPTPAMRRVNPGHEPFRMVMVGVSPIVHGQVGRLWRCGAASGGGAGQAVGRQQPLQGHLQEGARGGAGWLAGGFGCLATRYKRRIARIVGGWAWSCPTSTKQRLGGLGLGVVMVPAAAEDWHQSSCRGSAWGRGWPAGRQHACMRLCRIYRSAHVLARSGFGGAPRRRQDLGVMGL